MPRKTTKAYPDEIYRRVDGFRLFDDTFMSKVFDGQKKETALLLQIILDDPEIKVASVHAQVEIKNLQGRSVRLDIRARNSKGILFAVEVQRDDAGAIPQRAMYYSLLAERVRYFKETQKGRDSMCAIVEEYADERAKAEVTRANRQALIKGFRNGVLTKKGAAIMYPKLKATDIDDLYREAKKATRGRRPASH